MKGKKFDAVRMMREIRRGREKRFTGYKEKIRDKGIKW